MSVLRCPNNHLFSTRRYGDCCPYCGESIIPKKTDEEIQAEAEQFLNNPVTGWIVCTEGPAKGGDFRLLSGKTHLGRVDGMDIKILGDMYIAKRNHAIFAYDPRKRTHTLLPGESRGLIYVNGEIVYKPTKLSSWDTLELGKSKFLFLSLSSEQFDWGDTKLDNGNKNDESTNKKKEA